jgi:hypothetical protein
MARECGPVIEKLAIGDLGRYFHFKSYAGFNWVAHTPVGHDTEKLSFDFRKICHLMERRAK